MGKFDYEKVKDPTYFKENRLDAHSDHIAYPDRESMLRGENPLRMSLNGVWKFHYAHNYDETIPDFELPETDTDGWADIRVPAHIQMEGYDKPHYTNVQYPWDGHEQIEAGEIPTRFNPIAQYVKTFTLPERMENRPVYISFQGVESALALWCNGVFVGYAEDTFTPSEFDLTPYLVPGENRLAALVPKWCGGSWCEDQDFFRLSGIFRDVYLYTIPSVHVRDLKVETILDDDFADGEIRMTLQANGNGSVQAEVYPAGWHYPVGSVREALDWSLWGPVGKEPAAETTFALTGGETHAAIEIDDVMLWSAEQPNLYVLLLTVMDEYGNVTEVIPQMVGMRRFEMKDRIMCLNGKRIVFKGVNRHEFSSVSGRVPREEELWTDLVTMKRHNINAIRTCHYPNDSRLYALCDRLGLYLIDECNLESHGSWEPVGRGIADAADVVPGNQPAWRDIMLDRANSMYQRDKNHAAILIWSCGNESFGGSNIAAMSDFFHKVDPGRLVHYEGIFHDRSYPATSDMESQMYTPAADIEAWLKRDRSKPFISCEYSHAMGNSCGGMHKYTDLTDREPLYQGGFIWDYVDQSIYQRDRYGVEFQAYGGDFGERPSDYNFSGNGIVYGGDRAPSPKMQEVKYNYRNIDVTVEREQIHIVNKNLFTDASDFECYVTVEREGYPVCTKDFCPKVAPLSEETYPNPVRLPDESGEYTVTVSFRLAEDEPWARAGHEVAFGQGTFRVGYAEHALFADRPICRSLPLQIVQGKSNLGVRGENFEALFSYSSGGMVSYRYAGEEMLKSVPKPNFWRAPTDNDCGCDMPGRYGQWKLASLYLKQGGGPTGVKGQNSGGNPTVREEDGCAVVTYYYRMPTRPVSECRLTYRVYGDGTVETTLLYDPVEGLGDMPEFGVLMKLDADYDHLEWYGNGPAETYADRREGAKLGLYHNLVADNMARYMVPQECGNKTDVRYAKVTNRKGRGMLFAGDCMNFSALPYTPHEMECASHPNELPPVHYTVIRASLAQMGIGGDDSWGARPHTEYLLPADESLEFTFVFKGI